MYANYEIQLQIMFSLIPSDANDPQGMTRR